MISITKKDVVWNYFGTIINLSMNILILPVVLKLLSPHELGMWYVFGSIGALVQLMDFGFSPSIARNFSYALSGAKELLSEGVPDVDNEGQPNTRLLNGLATASRKLYFVVSAFSFVILVTVGSLYIDSILPDNSRAMMSSWIIYSATVFLNIYISYLSVALRGIGKIKEINQITVVSRVIYIAVAVFGLLVGGGLQLLCISTLVSGAVLGLLLKREYHRTFSCFFDMRNHAKESVAEVLKSIWPNAKKQGIVAIGGWLVTRAGTLLCSSFLGLETTSMYGLSMQFITVIGGISSLLYASYVPELASLKVGNHNARYMRVFSRAITVQWIFAFLGISVLVFVLPSALALIGSNTKLLPRSALLIMGIVYFLEWNHSTFSGLITLSNSVPFVKASVLSGFFTVTLGVLSIQMTDLGIHGLIMSQGIVQLAYNNWFWPRLVLRQNNISMKRILISGVIDILGSAKALLGKENH